MRINIFQSDSLSELQNEVNNHIDGYPEELIFDFKYSIEHRAVTTDSETGVFPDALHTIIVVLKET